MKILHMVTGKQVDAVVVPVVSGDFRKLSRSRYFFDWSLEREREIYKLCRRGEADILGLISIERIPMEWRLHIRLLAASKENIGSEKLYSGIAANLILHVSKIALENYGEMACVSLIPKTTLIDHYMQEFGMRRTGKTLSMDFMSITRLIQRYGHE